MSSKQFPCDGMAQSACSTNADVHVPAMGDKPVVFSPKPSKKGDGAQQQSTRELNNNDAEMFSPTSAAALALSTLHHFGADRDNRRPSAPEDLKGTRLFNGGEARASSANPREQAPADAPTSDPPDPHAAVGVPYHLRPQFCSYSSDSPTTGTASHYQQPPPPLQYGHPHTHHGYAYPLGYGGGWSQQQLPHSGAPGTDSSHPSASSPWPANHYMYPPSGAGINYHVCSLFFRLCALLFGSISSLKHSLSSVYQSNLGSQGSTPSSMVGPSPPSSRGSSACGLDGRFYHPHVSGTFSSIRRGRSPLLPLL